MYPVTFQQAKLSLKEQAERKAVNASFLPVNTSALQICLREEGARWEAQCIEIFKQNQFWSPRWLIYNRSTILSQSPLKAIYFPKHLIRLTSYMQHYLLLGYFSYLNGNRKGNSCRRHWSLYSYLIWALWLSHMCPVLRRSGVRVSSHPCCWALKRHVKGAGFVRNWWGLNCHLNLTGTEQAKICCTLHGIIIWVALGKRHE